MSMDVLHRNKIRMYLKQIGRLNEGPKPGPCDHDQAFPEQIIVVPGSITLQIMSGSTIAEYINSGSCKMSLTL